MADHEVQEIADYLLFPVQAFLEDETRRKAMAEHLVAECITLPQVRLLWAYCLRESKDERQGAGLLVTKCRNRDGNLHGLLNSLGFVDHRKRSEKEDSHPLDSPKTLRHRDSTSLSVRERVSVILEVVDEFGSDTGRDDQGTPWERLAAFMRITEKEVRVICKANGIDPCWDRHAPPKPKTMTDPAFEGKTAYCVHGVERLHHGCGECDPHNFLEDGGHWSLGTPQPPADIFAKLARKLTPDYH